MGKRASQPLLPWRRLARRSVRRHAVHPVASAAFHSGRAAECLQYRVVLESVARGNECRAGVPPSASDAVGYCFITDPDRRFEIFNSWGSLASCQSTELGAPFRTCSTSCYFSLVGTSLLLVNMGFHSTADQTRLPQLRQNNDLGIRPNRRVIAQAVRVHKILKHALLPKVCVECTGKQ